MKKYSELFAYLYLIIALLIASCGGPEEGVQLSDLELFDLEGKPLNSNNYEGKRVFVNFWATWCRPCIEEMPSIAAAKESLEQKNVAFLLASDEEIERIQKFSERRNNLLPFVQIRNMDQFNIRAIPYTLIFNEKGMLVHSEMGARDWSTEEAIELISGTENK